MWEGPEEALTLTENQQPALLAAGYAAYRAFLEAGGKPPALAAGHSLGSGRPTWPRAPWSWKTP